MPEEIRYATLVTVNASMEDFDNIATMAGESVLPWMRQFEGYEGMLVLSDQESRTAHFVTLWNSKEAMDKSAHSRAQVREQLAKTAGAEITGAGAFTVVVADGVS